MKKLLLAVFVALARSIRHRNSHGEYELANMDQVSNAPIHHSGHPARQLSLSGNSYEKILEQFDWEEIQYLKSILSVFEKLIDDFSDKNYIIENI